MSEEFSSVEDSLLKNIPEAELNEVWRILYGKKLQ